MQAPFTPLINRLMGVSELHCTLGKCTETECVNRSGRTCIGHLQVNLVVQQKVMGMNCILLHSCEYGDKT